MTGAPDGWKYETLNFYQGEYYQGAEQYFYNDAQNVNIDNFGRSLVVTGCRPWTVYEYDRYSGRAVCFYPSDTSRCSPGFFRNDQFMNGMSNRASSVRMGCYSKIKMIGSSHPFKSDNVGPLGKEGQFFAKH